MTPRFILITTAAILLAGCDKRSAEVDAARAAEITAQRQNEQAANDKVRALEELAGLYDRDHRFTAADVCRIHRLWLGGIYSWAGLYRQVNVKKDDFPFAAAAHIP